MRWETFELKRNKIAELEKQYWPMAVTQMETSFGKDLTSDFCKS